MEEQPQQDKISVQVKERNDMRIEALEKTLDMISETYDVKETDALPSFIPLKQEKQNALINSSEVINQFHIQQYVQMQAESLEHQTKQQDMLHQLIPQNLDLPLDQYVQISDELLKQSMFIYEKLNYSNIQKVAPSFSNIKLFMKNITYPESQLFIILEPRNVLNDLPGLYNPNMYDTKEQYHIAIQQQLINIGKQIENEISALVTYGSPIFRQPDEIVFELYEQIYTNIDQPEFIQKLREALLENKQLLFVSKKYIPTFMLEKQQTKESKAMYDNFVADHISILLTQQEKYLKSAVDTKQYLKLYAQIAGQKYIEEGTRNYYSNDLKIISMHLLSIDNPQMYDDLRAMKSLTLDKMFLAPKDMKSIMQNGLLDLKVIQSEHTEEISQKLIRNGTYEQYNDNLLISNIIIDPKIEYKYPDGQDNVSLAKVLVRFRSIVQSFNFGSANVIPKLEQIVQSADQQLLFSGTTVCYDKARNVSPEALPLLLNFPFKILSHCSLKIENLAGDLKIGFQLENSQVCKVSLETGAYDIPQDYKQNNLAIIPGRLQKLQAGDILVLSYFINGKPLKQYLNVVLVRESAAQQLLAIEVPQERAQLSLWMLHKDDVITIIRGRMNVMSAQPKKTQKSKQ